MRIKDGIFPKARILTANIWCPPGGSHVVPIWVCYRFCPVRDAFKILSRKNIVVLQNRGPQYRHHNESFLIIRTATKVPLILGNTQLLGFFGP